MRKQLDTTRMKNELEASAFFGSGGFPQKSSSVQVVEPKPAPALPPPGAHKTAQPVAQKVEQPSAQKVEQLSKSLSNEAIEALAFKLRKLPKSKVSAEIPLEWREKFDALAYELGVGKYELLMYILGAFLGEIEG